VDTGTEIRIKGEGHAGSVGGPQGDLVVITRLRPHAVFTRKGDNLYCDLPVTITEAVLGARVEVPAPNGVTFMILPPGTQSGQIFRLRGRGSHRLYSEGRGDLYVTVQVVIPKEIGPRTEELFRELERLNPDNPRSTLFAQSGISQKGPSDDR
jgi:DnaJ-class molecular chaperone